MTWENIEIGKKTPTARVTFTLSNTIRFNKTFIEKYKLQKSDKVGVLFNIKDEKIRIGFLFFTPEEKEENTLKLSWLDGSGAFISAYSIMAKLKVGNKDLRKKDFIRRFVPYLEDFNSEKKIFVIDFAELKKGSEVKKESEEK